MSPVSLVLVLFSLGTFVHQDPMLEDLGILDAVLANLPEETVRSFEGQTIKIDPRALLPSDSITIPDKRLLMELGVPLLDGRRELVTRYGYGTTDAVSDAACMWTGGAVMDPEVPRDISPECREFDYVAIALGRARPGGAWLPGMAESEASPDARTVRLIAFTSSSHTVCDITVHPSDSGAWELEAVRVYIHTMS